MIIKKTKRIVVFVLMVYILFATDLCVYAAESWSSWSTVPVPEGKYIKETNTQYRYKDKKVIKATSKPTTPTGYTYFSSENTGTYTAWGAWSSWSTTARANSTLVNTETCTGYRYYSFRCKNCGSDNAYSYACPSCGGSVSWVEDWGTCSGYAYSSGYTTVNSQKGKIYWKNRWWYFELNGAANGAGGYGQVTTTLYRYRTRQQYVNYNYWMTNYTSWSFDLVTASSSREVQTRNVYRYKKNVPQTITASSKKTTYGAKAFSLNAKASAGGKLSYKSGNKNIAVVSSTGKVTPKGYGKVTITITASANGSYAKAVKKITVTVNPKKMSVSKLSSPARRKMKITWKKDNTVNGYEVMFSTKKNFSSNTYKRSFAKGTISTTVTGLTSKKTFYVKIRSYKKVNGTKYYGAWSDIKSVKIK